MILQKSLEKMHEWKNRSHCLFRSKGRKTLSYASRNVHDILICGKCLKSRCRAIASQLKVVWLKFLMVHVQACRKIDHHWLSIKKKEKAKIKFLHTPAEMHIHDVIICGKCLKSRCRAQQVMCKHVVDRAVVGMPVNRELLTYTVLH